MKPAIAMVFLNMNTTTVFLFGQINNLYEHVCVYAYDVFTEMVAAGVCSAKYYLCFGITNHFVLIKISSSKPIRISTLTFRRRINMSVNTVSS